MFKNWVIERGPVGPRMSLHGPWSKKAKIAIASKGVKDLELNYVKGWSGSDVSFLGELAGYLEGFQIIDHSIDDVGPINSLTSLRVLDVNTYCKTALEFSNFPNLEDCSLEWRPKASSLFEHTGIRSLWINKCSCRDLTVFRRMETLEELRLASPKLESLTGVQELSKLRYLGLYVARRLGSLAGLETLGQLTRLEVETCRKVRDIKPIGALKRLKTMHLIDCGEVETLKSLSGLKELEEFFFYESTNVLDGDLSPLASLPNLKEVAFMERRHYSHSMKDLPSR